VIARHIRGWLFEPGRSAAEPVVLVVDGTGDVTVTGAGATPMRAFAWREAQVDERIGDTDRRLMLPDGTAIEVADNDAIDALERAFGRGRGRFIAALERRWAYAVAAIALTILAAWAVVRFAVPAVADIAAAEVPPPMAAKLDTQVLDAISKLGTADTQLPQERRDTIDGLLRRLVADGVGTTPWQYRLVFVDMPRVGANAFALPGGTIVVTDQLVKLAKTDDEIAAVLAHEVGHVESRHGLKSLMRGAGLGALTLFIFGDVTSISHVFVSFPVFLINSAYSRDFESEADAKAVGYLRRAHLPPEALVEMLESLESACGARCSETPGWLSNHPLMPERLTALRARVAAP
jgi:Zn-dependent protease with chaperone function